MELKCKHCGEIGSVERRGTVTTNDVVKQRIKCFSCGKWGLEELTYANIPKFEKTPEEIERLANTERFLITSSQNNTELDKRFWKALLKYATHIKAQLVVIPVLYRNPTQPGEKEATDAWWPKEVIPFLMENELRIGYKCRIMGNVRIQATAVNPLTGFESLTQGDSAIFGHGQIQMKTIATPQHRLPKILTTTGSTSLKNYSATKTGIKGDFHHSLGAVIVEVDNEITINHIRNITGDNNSEFYDLDKHVNHHRVKIINSIPALVTGDEHHMYMSEEVRDATYMNADSIVQVLRPKYIVRHDIIDSYSISHHHNAKPSIRYAKQWNEKNRLEDELWISANFLNSSTPTFSTNVIVPSNHHDHIKQWLEEMDWRQDLPNAKLFHEMWVAWLQAIEDGRDFHPFVWWMKQHCKADTLYLTEDYPFIVEGIYLGYHGDRGPDGAKGNIRNMSKIGAKTIVGHTHSPGIEKGCYQVGTSTQLKLEYTKGPSSWLNTHCLVHANGKRQLVNVIKGEWRLQNAV